MSLIDPIINCDVQTRWACPSQWCCDRTPSACWQAFTWWFLFLPTKIAWQNETILGRCFETHKIGNEPNVVICNQRRYPPNLFILGVLMDILIWSVIMTINNLRIFVNSRTRHHLLHLVNLCALKFPNGHFNIVDPSMSTGVQSRSTVIIGNCKDWNDRYSISPLPGKIYATEKQAHRINSALCNLAPGIL